MKANDRWLWLALAGVGLIGLTLFFFFRWFQAPNDMAKLAMLIVASIYMGWSAFLAWQKTKHLPERDEWLGALLSPVAIMVLALAANALAFLQDTWVMWEMETGQYIILMDGSYALEVSPLLELLIPQMSVLLGTISLMEVVRRALHTEIDFEQDTSHLAGVYIQVQMFEELMKRHWLAILGLGTVFGVGAGSGPVLLLAVELTLMWGMAKLYLYRKRRG